MLNKIFQSRFTPFIIISAILVIAVIFIFINERKFGNEPHDDWGSLALFISCILITIMMVIDMLLWHFIKPAYKKWVWLGELAAITGFILYVRFS